MLINALLNLILVFKPLHVMDTPELSCGATERLMKETVKLSINDLMLNGMKWKQMPDDEDGDYVIRFQVREDQYTYLQMTFNSGGAYLELNSIDVKRNPCRDMIYLKRVR